MRHATLQAEALLTVLRTQGDAQLLAVAELVVIEHSVDADFVCRMVRAAATSAPGPGYAPLPRLQRDWSRPVPRLQRDWARCCHTCTGSDWSCAAEPCWPCPSTLAVRTPLPSHPMGTPSHSRRIAWSIYLGASSTGGLVPMHEELIMASRIQCVR